MKELEVKEEREGGDRERGGERGGEEREGEEREGEEREGGGGGGEREIPQALVGCHSAPVHHRDQ